MFYFLVGLVLSYPVSHLLPTFVHRSFPSTPPAPPLLRIPLVRFSATPPVASPPPFPWKPRTADARCCLLSLASSSCHPTMNRSTASRTSRYHLPAFFAAVDYSAVSTPNTKGASSADPSVARNSLTSSTMHLCQVLNCLPDLGFSRPGIVPNITRLGNRSLLRRAMLSAKKGCRLRMVVSISRNVPSISRNVPS